jgi:YHS domain-containing protein
MKLVFSLVCLLFIYSANAQSPVFSKGDKAIQGYDAVAYFKLNQPTPGKNEFMYEWNDGKWYFSSKENLELFKKEPQKYAPQYGGYCAYGMSNGYKAPTSPDAFTIVNDKLYLNYNVDVRQTWNKDQKSFIQKADQNWPNIKNKE